MALWKNGEKVTIKARRNDVYLLFNGQSVNSPYVSTISVGNCYSPSDIWVGMNRPEDYCLKELPSQSKKIFRKYFQHLVSDAYLADIAQPRNGIIDIFRLRSCDVYFVWLHHSLGVALHVAVWMGFKRIHFVGLSPNGYEHLMERSFMHEFTRLSGEYGIDCINCTYKSALNGFMDFSPLDEALDISKELLTNTHIKE